MSQKNKFQFWAVFLVFILCLSLIRVQPVLADEGTPTDVPVAGETETPTEPTVAPTEVPTEATPSGDEVVVDQVLAQIPDDTTVVLLDENGNPVPLASQEASELIQVGDPIWCPNGVTPIASTGGCTASYLTLAALLPNLPNTNTDGTIWILAGADASASAVTIDGSTLTNLQNASLTLQGGWAGLGSTSVNAGTPSTFTVPLAITNWSGNIFVNNITISNVSTANSLTVNTTGDISLNGVAVNEQAGINFTASLTTTSGDITVQNSTFDGKTTGGARNMGFNASSNSGSIAISNTTFQEAFRPSINFNYNGATLSAPAITLNNVIAQNNDGNGIIINGNASTIVKVAGGSFINNGEYGLKLNGGGQLLESTAPTCTNNTLGCYNVTAIADSDLDGVANGSDLCANTPSNETANANGCSPSQVDSDSDGVPDMTDNCLNVANPDQSDSDGDGAGNACDATPNGDDDSDGVDNMADSCPTEAGPSSNSGCPVTAPSTILGGSVVLTGEGSTSTQGLIPVTGTQFTQLSCAQPFITLNKPGLEVVFNALCGYSVALDVVQENGLPGPLQLGFTFFNGVSLDLQLGNAAVNTLPEGATITLSFELPADQPDAIFTILYWDPNANNWVEQESTVIDGKLVVAVNSPGIFVMAEDTTTGQGSSQPHVEGNSFYSVVMNWFNKMALTLGFS